MTTNSGPRARPILLMYGLIICLGLSPFLVALVGSGYHTAATGLPCGENSCVWAVLPWFCFFTIPGAAVLGLAYSVYLLVRYVR